jgi:hypothetical protein
MINASAMCWARFVPMLTSVDDQQSSDEQVSAAAKRMPVSGRKWFTGEGLDGDGVGGLTSGQQKTVTNCLTKPMASELNVRGCIFGFAEIYISPDHPVFMGQSFAEWCHMFVDEAKTTGTLAQKDRERLRFSSCIAGGMYVTGHGNVALHNIPSWVVDAHCADLENDPAMSWLSRAERKEVHKICTNTGKICSIEGACSEFAEFLKPAGDALEDPAGTEV